MIELIALSQRFAGRAFVHLAAMERLTAGAIVSAGGGDSGEAERTNA